jgi:hypothetical protein
VVDAMRNALERDRIRDSRHHPGRARVGLSDTVIAPDAHTPTVPSTTAEQSVTPRNGASAVPDIDRSDNGQSGRRVAYWRLVAIKITKPLDGRLSRYASS